MFSNLLSYENTVSVDYYTAWGINISGIHSTNDGKIPSSTAASRFDKKSLFGYKGYYCDDESNYYYLQSRYYIADWCRFMNADLPEYAQLQKDEPTGTNLFAYCCNDPVNNMDPEGDWGADIHYGRKHKKGKKYDGTYEWAVQVGFNKKYAAKIAEGDWDIDTNKNTTANPLRAIGADKSLSNRQRYHFNRAKRGAKDTRIVEAQKFYNSAVNSYKKAIQNFDKAVKGLKKQYSTSSSTYRKKYNNYVKTRDKGISTACFTLGKALHCYQDVYAHGNIDAGYGHVKGHVLVKNADNPYYAWKPGSNETKVDKKSKLTSRYYNTRDKTKKVLYQFLRDISKYSFYNYVKR